MKKLLLTILLFCCSFSLIAQSQTKQRFMSLGEAAFNEQLPFPKYLPDEVVIDRVIDDYVFHIPREVPLYVPKMIKNVTVKVWSTYDSFGKRYRDSVVRTYDVTYKDGMLRTLQRTFQSKECIFQYEFKNGHPIRYNIYEVETGALVGSYNCDRYKKYVVWSNKDENYYSKTYITNRDPVVKKWSSGGYGGYAIEVGYNGREQSYQRVEWSVKRSFIAVGARSWAKAAKGGYNYITQTSEGRQWLKDSFSRFDWPGPVTYRYDKIIINPLGLLTNTSAFDCLIYGWSNKSYDITYDYE